VEEGMIRRVAEAVAEMFPYLFWRFHRLVKCLDGFLPWRWRKAASARLAARKARIRPRVSRRVVFVSEIPRMREVKLGTALRSAGWEVILLSREAPPAGNEAAFSRLVRYRDRWEALLTGAALDPVVFHVFACWNYYTALEFVRRRPGPVVIDVTDVMKGLSRDDFLDLRYPGQSEMERECLEQSDGVCCRSLEVQFLKRRLGYRLRGKVLFLPDLSMGGGDRPPRTSRDASEIHVVQIGIPAYERIAPEERDGHFLNIARRLVADGVHFHLYAGTPRHRTLSREEILADYRELERSSPYMHLHDPVPFDRLMKEMEGFTFGLHLAGESLHYVGNLGTSTRERYDFSLANRAFDYMRAGVGMVLHNGRFINWMVRRLGVGLTADPGFLESPRSWLQDRWPSSEEWAKLEAAADKTDLRHQTPRLERFYSLVAGSAADHSRCR
jgi:hypothetical protein